MKPKRKYAGRFPDRPTLKPADHTVDGKPLIVRHPIRKNGRFPALAAKGEEVDCSATSEHRNYWFRRWRCGDVEIVGEAKAKPKNTTRKPPAPPAEES